MTNPLNDTAWKRKGKCYDTGHTAQDYVIWDSFFADTVGARKPAMAFCEGCPVQKRCLRFALETQQLWGVWGGRDEAEIRRDLWINSNGTIGGRARRPRCAWCKAKPESLIVTDAHTNRVTCQECGFSWCAETTRMGVEDGELDDSTEIN